MTSFEGNPTPFSLDVTHLIPEADRNRLMQDIPPNAFAVIDGKVVYVSGAVLRVIAPPQDRLDGLAGRFAESHDNRRLLPPENLNGSRNVLGTFLEGIPSGVLVQVQIDQVNGVLDGRDRESIAAESDAKLGLFSVIGPKQYCLYEDIIILHGNDFRAHVSAFRRDGALLNQFAMQRSAKQIVLRDNPEAEKKVHDFREWFIMNAPLKERVWASIAKGEYVRIADDCFIFRTSSGGIQVFNSTPTNGTKVETRTLSSWQHEALLEYAVSA